MCSGNEYAPYCTSPTSKTMPAELRTDATTCWSPGFMILHRYKVTDVRKLMTETPLAIAIFVDPFQNPSYNINTVSTQAGHTD